MKHVSKRSGKVGKGAPSGFVISLLVHAGAFFLAGIFVVFSVVNKPEPEFMPPPPIERPKMKLKKPKVKVKKSSQPKPSSRIVAKVKTREMPEIQLPDLMGTGEGLIGGTGFGGEIMDLPDIGELTLFGGEQTDGSDLQVTFYSMALNKDGTPNAMCAGEEFTQILRKFVKSGWNKRKLAKFYESPRKFYSSTIFIPPVPSMLGPSAFGENKDYGYCWVALYEGKLVYKDDITFRFWGGADDILDVAVDGKTVLAANYWNPWFDDHPIEREWSSKAPNNRVYMLGEQKLAGGDWITLEAGVPLDFKAIIGESPGGTFQACLVVEVQGEEYPLNDAGAPIFPVFSTSPLSWALQDSIMENLAEGEANVTNVTPIFRDY